MSFTFCRIIQLDFENYKIYFNSSLTSEDSGLKLLECESITEHISGRRGSKNERFRYLGIFYIYRVEDEKKFLLTLIKTGINYKELDPNSY